MSVLFFNKKQNNKRIFFKFVSVTKFFQQMTEMIEKLYSNWKTKKTIKHIHRAQKRCKPFECLNITDFTTKFYHVFWQRKTSNFHCLEIK